MTASMTLVERAASRIQLWWMTQKHEPMHQNDATDLAKAALASTLDALETAEKALERARPIIQAERDGLVLWHSCPPDKNAADFDPGIRDAVAEMDGALADIDSALEKMRGGL